MGYLVIDCGNSQAKFAYWQHGGFVVQFSLSNRILLSEEAILELKQALMGLDSPQSIWVSSVVPTIYTALENILVTLYGKTIQSIDHNSFGNMQVLTDNPSEVGADRLVNAFAARHLFGNGQMVIDFGTATTIDVLDQAGNYAGGVILPGLDLTLQTLHQATAKLPLVRIKSAKRVLGKNTIDAINQGIYWGYVAMLEGLVLKLQTELGYVLHVVATGGYANLWNDDAAFMNKIDQELTLKGLVWLAEMNEKS